MKPCHAWSLRWLLTGYESNGELVDLPEWIRALADPLVSVTVDPALTGMERREALSRARWALFKGLLADRPDYNRESIADALKGIDPDGSQPPSYSYRDQDDWWHNVPYELLYDFIQWVLWRYEHPGMTLKKVPYRPTKLKSFGKFYPSPGRASTTNPNHWRSCVDAANTDGSNFNGLGFVFAETDPFVGIDIDNCMEENGSILEWARSYVERLATTYGEYSPSGNGIKFFARGSLPDGGRRFDGLGPDGTGKVEMYDRGRYFTVTGNTIDPDIKTCAELGPVVRDIYAELVALRPDPPQEPAREAEPAPTQPNHDWTDDDRLDEARKAKNGKKFVKLFYDGDISDYKNDDSRADLALCCMLAWWTNRDPERIDRLFRRSKLYREKWEREGYRNDTIAKAIACVKEGYKGPRSRRTCRPPAAADLLTGGGVVGGGRPVAEADPQQLLAAAEAEKEQLLAEIEAVKAKGGSSALLDDAGLLQRLVNLRALRRDKYGVVVAKLYEIPKFPRKLFADALKPFRAAVPNRAPTDTPTRNGPRGPIEIEVSVNEHVTNGEACEALALDRQIYQRGNILVEVLRDEAKAKLIGRQPGTPRIVALPEAKLRDRLTIFANWYAPSDE